LILVLWNIFQSAISEASLMKFGLKLHSSNHLLYRDAIDAIESGLADYLELTYFSSKTSNLDLLRESKIPIVLHSAHAGQGVNYSGPELDRNMRELAALIRAADHLDAQYIIVHSDRGQIENLVKVLTTVPDSRLLVENMPKAAVAGGDCVGFSQEELGFIMKKCSCGFCLDFGHAFKAALSLDISFGVFCNTLLALRPSMFHMAQGGSAVEYDEHLDLDQGEIDLSYVKDVIHDVGLESFVTIEVPFKDGIKNTLKNIEYIAAL